ncbi:DNA photolyase family protein [Allokutzneria sp. A3M-2-11 16]|uniref:cryptochrome/photolyase family protein n=1 Tax=Allokutzneria sp. A3M-2-11 16 TaxID=2962043 RepID=UPI0020B8F45C|nr:deoxyribodipyrimidine photo-lyase [Allokutzneria sp. A3M-2-11 16]MCP3800153.1 DNA photolyase family protein [Allokutzneria sp. A3M-2-11 16]
MSASILWFRRDLRLGDHPALAEAGRGAGRVLALYVLDPRLLGASGAPRRTFLYRCLRELDERLGGRLHVVHGDPTDVLPRVVREFEATSVHVSADAGPYGRERDALVEKAIDAEFVRTGSPYAITPGRVVKGDGTPFKVFTPFYRAWKEHGWRGPAKMSTVDWVDPSTKDCIPEDEDLGGMTLPAAGEAEARRAWRKFREVREDYAEHRDRPDLPGTSRMSPYLRWGCVHPRTLLADLGEEDEAYRRELAFRDFYADVLWHRPETARENYDRKFDAMPYDTGDELFEAWCAGKTGFPIVDAGMRQLLAEGWMHNRVRMIVASFLAKDLHLWWRRGAAHFMRHLVDGDLASNQHGWQWAAGTGTDASPYFRVFNPITQGEKFDPNGDYVRKYVPELRGVPGKHVHQPWRLDGGVPPGYPPPIVDHAEERLEALRRYDIVKAT